MSANADRGVKVEIYLPDGSTEGIWKIERDPDWNGIVLYCSKTSYALVKEMKEFGWPGIYILRDQSDEQIEPTIYIGEGDPVRNRIDDHCKNKPFWKDVFICVGVNGKSDKARIQYLESRLIVLAKEAKHCKLEQNTPTLPTYEEPNSASSENYLGKLLSILRILGVKVFEKPKSESIAFASNKSPNLAIETKKVSAKGILVSSGFVVLKDSQAVLNEVPLATHGLIALRKNLCEKNILVPEGNNLKFTQNYEFDTPSGAAAVVLGRAANGYHEWKNADGTRLKDLEAETGGLTEV